MSYSVLKTLTALGTPWSSHSKTLSGSVRALQTLVYHYHLNALDVVSEISKVGESLTRYVINLIQFSVSGAFGLFLGHALADRDGGLCEEFYFHKLPGEWENASVAGVGCFTSHCVFLLACKLTQWVLSLHLILEFYLLFPFSFPVYYFPCHWIQKYW